MDGADRLREEARRHAGDAGLQCFCGGHLWQGRASKDTKEAGVLATKYKTDRDLLRRRVSAGLDVLEKSELTDPKKVAAIGYCFGGRP